MAVPDAKVGLWLANQPKSDRQKNAKLILDALLASVAATETATQALARVKVALRVN